MLFNDIFFFIGRHIVMVSGTFEWPKRAQNGIKWLKKHYFLNVLIPVLLLASVRLPNMCVGTMAGWKPTEVYVVLHLTTGITFHYFPLLWQLHSSCFWYSVI